MVLRVFAGACVLYSLPPRVYHMIQICRRRRTEAQVALRTNLGTSMRYIKNISNQLRITKIKNSTCNNFVVKLPILKWEA
jgi:hypothetical protein